MPSVKPCRSFRNVCDLDHDLADHRLDVFCWLHSAKPGALVDVYKRQMLTRVGVKNIDALFTDIPEAKRLNHDLDLPHRETEMDVERLLSGLAAKNVAAGSVPFFVGAGAYKHHVPASVDHLIQRSEFLTSYTPYQPEIADVYKRQVHNRCRTN